MRHLITKIEKLEAKAKPTDDQQWTIDNWRRFANASDAELAQAQAELSQWEADHLTLIAQRRAQVNEVLTMFAAETA